MTIATWTGEVLANGTPLGKRGTLIATPAAEGTWVNAGDHIAHGSAKAETDGSGVLQGGLDVEDVDGLLYTLTWEPHDNSGSVALGTYDLSGGGDIATLVETDYLAISETTALQIAAAAALGATNDTATASFVNNGASSTTTALKGREIGFNVLKGAGIVADGTTDDSAALASLIASANTFGVPVVIPKGRTLALASALTLPAGTRLRGEQGAILKATATMNAVAVVASANVTVEGITFQTNGNAANCLQVNTGGDKLTLRRNRFEGTTAATNAINVPTGTVLANLIIDDNDFVTCPNNVRISSASITHLEITRNRITNWYTRGIYLLGDATNACDDVLIFGNSITNLVSGQIVRYPIRTESTGKKHTNVRISNNHIRGPGVKYDNATNVGTADQISMTFVDGGIISNNFSIGGGDGGMTVTNCDGVAITGNVIFDCANGGIYCGANGSTSPGTHRVTISGNTILGAGRDTALDVHDTAVRIYDADTVTVTGNTLGNLPGGTVTTHGVTYLRGDNVTIVGNTNAQCAGTFTYDGGGSTNISTGSAGSAAFQSTNATTTATPTSSSVETTLATHANIPSSTLNVGDRVKFKAIGNFDSQVTPGAFNLRTKVNGTTQLTVVLATVGATAGATAAPWQLDLDLIITATGAGGSYRIVGTSTRATGNTNARTVDNQSIDVSQDLTGGLLLSLTGATVTASATNTIRHHGSAVEKL